MFIVDFKIMPMSADVFVKIELLRFFAEAVIYKKLSSSPRGRDLSHRQQMYLLYQPKGDTPWNPSQ